MATEAEPIIGNWYCNLDKGQRFRVVAFDSATEAIETQDFEGTLAEYDLNTWYSMNLEVCAAPESWAGAQDIGNAEDYNTENTETRNSDWNEPADDFGPPPIDGGTVRGKKS